MKITIPVITGELALEEYAPQLGDQTLVVWLNPPSGLIDEYDDAYDRVTRRTKELRGLDPENEAHRKRAAALAEESKPDVERMLAIVSELLSAGPEGTKVSKAELEELIAELGDANPGFYGWVVRRLFGMIMSYRAAQKKS